MGLKILWDSRFWHSENDDNIVLERKMDNNKTKKESKRLVTFAHVWTRFPASWLGQIFKRGNASCEDSLIRQIFLGNFIAALKMKLAVHPNDYLAIADMSEGIRMLVHNQTSMPLPDTAGINIPTGFDTRVAILRVS